MDELKIAIDTGEALEVWYFGGSNPGTIRKIAPVKIIDDQVRARCLEDNSIKSYSISKMEIYVPGVEPQQRNTHTFIPQEITSITKLLHHYKDTLEGLGWFVIGSENEITLHEKFKNGKPKKTPIISLNFEEFEYRFPEPDINDPEFDWDDFIPETIEGDILENAEKIPRKRPWIVRAKSKNTVSYALQNKAFTRFLEWANQLANSSS